MGNYSTKALTFKWNLEHNYSIRTHIGPNEYECPFGMECNEDCDFTKWDTNQTLWFFAENDMKFTKSPWYFFGDDFFFTKAEINFDFAEKVI